MDKTKYGKYISKEIIEESGYSQITAPMVRYRGDRGGRDMTFEWYCITQPVVMDKEPTVNDGDQFMFFVGSDILDCSDFQAEVELPLGKEGKMQIIKEDKFVYIPSGLVHGPVKFKNVKKPVVLLSMHFSPKYSKKWNESETDYEKYMRRATMMGNARKPLPFALEIKYIRGDGVVFREQKIKNSLGGYGAMVGGGPPGSGTRGVEANLSLGCATISQAHIGPEPAHSHTDFDEWIIYFGGNPLNIEEFDGEIEMWWGEEREKHVLNSTCVTHMPPGLIHGSNDHRRVGKPYQEIIMMNVPGGKYYKEKNKIFAKEGEIMLGEGAEV